MPDDILRNFIPIDDNEDCLKTKEWVHWNSER